MHNFFRQNTVKVNKYYAKAFAVAALYSNGFYTV